MKIISILLFTIILHEVYSVKIPPPPKVPRPSAFAAEVNTLLRKMATENGYGTKFDRCHIVPWKFMGDRILDHKNGKMSNTKMNNFIKDLAKIHKSASFYQELQKSTKAELETLTTKYKNDALAAVKTGDTNKLAKSLFNMASNLYPGDRSNNRSIQNNLDPPKEESTTGGRSTEATPIAKLLYRKYQPDGLTAMHDPSTPANVKSSDKPPGDTSGDYAKIT